MASPKPIPEHLAEFFAQAEAGTPAAPETATPPKKRKRVDIEELHFLATAEERAAAAWRNFGLPAADQPVLFFPQPRSKR